MKTDEVRKGIAKYGRSVYITDGEWNSGVYKALIQPLRYKNKMYMSGDFTQLGHYDDGFYLYIGPANHILSGLSNNARIHIADGTVYELHRTEKVYFGENPLYIWAVIKEKQ